MVFESVRVEVRLYNYKVNWRIIFRSYNARGSPSNIRESKQGAKLTKSITRWVRVIFSDVRDICVPFRVFLDKAGVCWQKSTCGFHDDGAQRCTAEIRWWESVEEVLRKIFPIRQGWRWLEMVVKMYRTPLKAHVRSCLDLVLSADDRERMAWAIRRITD